ncbi:MAG: hypothetical protein ACXWB2_05175 [Acidimicrobiales bacterium]
MADKSDFTDAEWKAVAEAPLLVTVTMFAAGQHGPISMIKESAAGARVIGAPGDRGAASGLINAMAAEAQTKEARHDAEHHKGSDLAAVIASCLADLEPAAAALKAHLPADEVAQVGGWLVDIAEAIAAASKGVSEGEKDTVGRIAAVFGVAAPG